MGCRLLLGDCRTLLPTLPAGSVDVVLTDPPYPHIKREYGYWTEAEWFDLMRAVVPECMRILKPTGSAVFILQPNSERVGRMRTWLWEFMLWVGKEWGIVQDHYWWNTCAFPEAHSIQGKLARPSVKICVWLGPAGCYRNQNAVLLPPDWQLERRKKLQARRRDKGTFPSGQQRDAVRMLAASERRGGVTPFNCLPAGNGSPPELRARKGHPAGTPVRVADYWLRYLCPPGGTACDPFAGSGTVGVAALKQGKSFIGVEALPKYHAIAERRLAAAQPEPGLFAS